MRPTIFQYNNDNNAIIDHVAHNYTQSYSNTFPIVIRQAFGFQIEFQFYGMDQNFFIKFQ